MDYYVCVRITDRDIDDIGSEYRISEYLLDCGRINDKGDPETQIQSNYYDHQGVLCELEIKEFYCDFSNCDDDHVLGGMGLNLSKLI